MDTMKLKDEKNKRLEDGLCEADIKQIVIESEKSSENELK